MDLGVIEREVTNHCKYFESSSECPEAESHLWQMPLSSYLIHLKNTKEKIQNQQSYRRCLQDEMHCKEYTVSIEEGFPVYITEVVENEDRECVSG